LLSCAIVKAARNVNGPAWIAPGLAAVMLLIGAGCAARLAIWRLRGRGTEPDADALHVFMGVAMAGMLEPRLSPVPGPAWRAVFAAAAAWFAWQAIRARRRRPDGWRCAHPAPHAVECAAMIYMLLPAHPAGPGPATAMPGMSEPAAAANPALALILALFMLGYILAGQSHGTRRPGTEGTRSGHIAGIRPGRRAHRRPSPRRAPRYPRHRGARSPVRRLLQDRNERRHGLHARHDALNSPDCRGRGRRLHGRLRRLQ
jgi:Domain of unknown function (DUF5134)